MALPSTGKKATATPSNPGSALTDFTFIVDLSDLPQAWWDDVNTSDGTRGRAAKNDETTELPVDWIDFDETAQTGLARIKYTGTKSASVSEPVIIYPPNTRNTAYAASDTYGQYNAYDSNVEGYWPLSQDFNDRTSNQYHGTATGSPTAGDVAGIIGKATDFDGSQYITLPSAIKNTFAGTVFAWSETRNIASGEGYIYAQRTSGSDDRFYLRVDATSGDFGLGFADQSLPISSDNNVANDGLYHSMVGKWSVTTAEGYLDGVSLGTYSGTQASGIPTINIGSALSSTSFAQNGKIQEVQVHSLERSDDYISYEYSQTSDNSTFWGTWTVSDVSGGTNYTGGVEQDQSIAGSLLIKSLFTGGVEQDQTIGGTITIVTEETAFAGGAQQPQNIGGTLKLVLSFAGVVEQGQTVAGTLKIVGADTNFSGGISQEQEISGIINVEDNRIVFAGGIEQTQGIGGGFTVVIQPTAFIGGIEQEQEISGYFRSLIEITPDIITCPGAIQRTVTLNGIIQTTLTIKGELS